MTKCVKTGIKCALSLIMMILHVLRLFLRTSCVALLIILTVQGTASAGPGVSSGTNYQDAPSLDTLQTDRLHSSDSPEKSSKEINLDRSGVTESSSREPTYVPAN
jgi:hypothetical protein